MTLVLGGRGHAPPGKFLKKMCNMVHSERSELIIPKSTTLGIINQQQQKLFSIFLPSINPDVHVNKQKHFIKGVLGHERPPPPPRSKDSFFLKKNKQNGGFSFKI